MCVPCACEPAPGAQLPGQQQAEGGGGQLHQLHQDAGLTALRLPVAHLQGPIVILILQEERLAVGHRPEHLEHTLGYLEDT